MFVFISPFIISFVFLQRHLRNWIANEQLKYNTLSEYCNTDVPSKVLLVLGVVSSSIRIYIVNNDNYLFYTAFLVYGVFTRTDNSLTEKYIHYFSVIVFFLLNIYLCIQLEDYILCFILIFLYYQLCMVVFDPNKKMLCFNIEWLFMTLATYNINRELRYPVLTF